MKFQIDKYWILIVFILFFTLVGYSQENQKIENIIISHPEMRSTSGVFIHFIEKGNYTFKILKGTETVFSKELAEVKQISFKIDFSDFNIGLYQIIIRDKNDNLLYDKQILKE
ncbi:MAG: hypothetical protein COA67_09170 [Lutibacter sp.]|nr:MAG: hypothetical protein COA67_09170 [Lutibacter sp.]